MAHASTRTIVQRLLQLASDPDNQAFIVQEQGCLAGLTSYLDDSDTEVVRMAIEAISLLSSNRSNRKNLVGIRLRKSKEADDTPQLGDPKFCCNSCKVLETS